MGLQLAMPEGAEKLPNVLRQTLRLFQGGKMAAARHFGPPLDVKEAFSPCTRRIGMSLEKQANAAGVVDDPIQPFTASCIQRKPPAFMKSWYRWNDDSIVPVAQQIMMFVSNSSLVNRDSMSPLQSLHS